MFYKAYILQCHTRLPSVFSIEPFIYFFFFSFRFYNVKKKLAAFYKLSAICSGFSHLWNDITIFLNDILLKHLSLTKFFFLSVSFIYVFFNYKRKKTKLKTDHMKFTIKDNYSSMTLSIVFLVEPILISQYHIVDEFEKNTKNCLNYWTSTLYSWCCIEKNL